MMAVIATTEGVPWEIAVPVLAAALAVGSGLFGWILSRMVKVGELLATTAVKLDAMEDRIERLERTSG